MSRGGSRWGAGRPSYRLKTHDSLSIDVRRWARDGLLKIGTFQWRWTETETGEERGNIVVTVHQHGLTLHYQFNGTPHAESIRLTTTACFLGGSRSWLHCPKCEKRCAKLFLRWGRFRCRTCNAISYASQSDDLSGRLWRAQQKIEARLGEDRSKPPRMRHTTYQRLMDRYWQLEALRDDVLLLLLERLGWPTAE